MLSADGFWAAEVNFLVCRLRLFARALQSPTPAIGPVYGATDIPPVSSLSERRKLGLILACSVPRVCDLRSGSPQEGSARVEYSKVVFTTFNASRTPENLL
jgi:hypothetical protein